MSILALTPAADVPEFDLADRLRKAARHADLTNGYLAATLHVSESTISGWLNGAHKPPKMAQLLFANVCQVDPGWLLTGTPGAAVDTPAVGAARRSSRTKGANRRPVDYMPGALSANSRHSAKRYGTVNVPILGSSAARQP